jgi:HAD superfamily hydrolase (TIGR01490 family)
MSDRRPLALFDLDHTLLPIDSDQSWGDFTLQLGWVDPSDFKARNDGFYQDYVAGTLDIHAYVRFATEAICRKGQAQSLAARARFMAEVIEPAIHTSAVQLVERHRQQGHRLVMVSATNEFVTAPIAERLGMDALIATELERDAQGWFTGSVLGTPSLREGKVTRVQAWLAQQGLDWADVETTFYSDSMNDLPLLAKVTQPVVTNPDARLKAEALTRGWPILQLFEPQ